MAPVSTYTVHAKRAGKYWELHIDGVGVTQSRNLGDDADEMIRNYVAAMNDVPEDSFAYTLKPEVGDGLDAEAAAARQAAHEAEEAVKRSAASNRAAARRLRDAGLTGRDIAVVLRVTPQRVSQFLSGQGGSRTVRVTKVHKGGQRKTTSTSSGRKKKTNA